MPAAAVIPAPIAYINVVAVKKLVVEPLVGWVYLSLWDCVWPCPHHLCGELFWHSFVGLGICIFYCEKIRVFKAGISLLNTLAWNNKIGFRYYFVGLYTEIMINRDSWGYSYLIVRGEILGFMKDELLRKHLPRMFSLIKNDS